MCTINGYKASQRPNGRRNGKTCRVLREPSSSGCEPSSTANCRVLCEPSSSARTVKSGYH